MVVILLQPQRKKWIGGKQLPNAYKVVFMKTSFPTRTNNQWKAKGGKAFT